MWKDLSNRYDIRLDEDQTWAVIDVFTGSSATYHGRELCRLAPRVAEELCVVLNALDKDRRRRLNAT